MMEEREVMTTLELAREVGVLNSNIVQLIDRVLKRRRQAGLPPVQVVTQEHAYNGNEKTICYELTPQIMRTLYHHPPAFSAIWQIIYEKHPEWVPVDRDTILDRVRSERASRRLREKKRAAEREAALRNTLRSAMSEADLIAAGLYSFTRAAQRLGFTDAYALIAYLRELRVITRRLTLWVLLPPYDGRGYTETVIRTVGRYSCDKTPFEVTVWTERGMAFLRKMIKQHNPQTTQQ